MVSSDRIYGRAGTVGTRVPAYASLHGARDAKYNENNFCTQHSSSVVNSIELQRFHLPNVLQSDTNSWVAGRCNAPAYVIVKAKNK